MREEEIGWACVMFGAEGKSILVSLIYNIYSLTAIELPPGGSSTAHIYTQTVQRTTQNKQYIEQHKV